MSSLDPLSLDFANRHPDAFARVLARGRDEEVAAIIESLPEDRQASIVARLPAPRINQLLDAGQLRPEQWLVAAPFDDAVMLLSRLPRERRLALVNALENRERQRQLLRSQQYPTHSVGALVGDVALRLNVDTLAAQVVTEIRDLDADDEPAVVIVDADGLYLGVLDHWRLLMRSPVTGRAGDYLLPVSGVNPETPIATVAMHEQWHSHDWLPVIDHRRRVLGVVTRRKVFRSPDAHSGPGSKGGDILLDILADLVYVGEALLGKALSRKLTP